MGIPDCPVWVLRAACPGPCTQGLSSMHCVDHLETQGQHEEPDDVAAWARFDTSGIAEMDFSGQLSNKTAG